MNRIARVFLLLILPFAGTPAWAETVDFDPTMIARVTSAAFSFVAPRALQGAPIPVMAGWGLRGLTVIDPRLAAEVAADGPLTLQFRAERGARVLVSRRQPAVGDAAGWGEAVAQVAHAAWEVSEPVRRAGGQAVLNRFFAEMFSHMDPYSRYAAPAEAADERAHRGGRIGIGLTTVRRGGIFMVTAVQADGPAAEAGLHGGERLVAVDGVDLHDVDAAGLEAALAGAENTGVELTMRGRDGRLRTVLVTREPVPPETVSAAILSDKRQGDVLLLRLSGFSRNTGSRVAQELIRARADARPMRGVVLDLRGNRGGVLQQAVASAAMLQPDGVVAVASGRAAEASHVFLANGRDLARGLPVVVLVDGDTASAAEVLAASLADQRRAVVVGSVSYGKGLVQTIGSLPDGGELLVTWSRLLAPLGWPIQGLGVLPQVCTSLGREVLGRQLAGLGRGVQPMQAALLQHRLARAPLAAAAAVDIRAACPAAAEPPSGDDIDMAAARSLLDVPAAYATALLSMPADLIPAALPLPPPLTPPLTPPLPGVSDGPMR